MMLPTFLALLASFVLGAVLAYLYFFSLRSLIDRLSRTVPARKLMRTIALHFAGFLLSFLAILLAAGAAALGAAIAGTVLGRTVYRHHCDLRISRKEILLRPQH